jgi:hypothetical protein
MVLNPLHAQTTIKSEMTGAWYNTNRSGEGLLIEILNNDNALVTFYTYNSQRQQVWLIGVGEIIDNKILNINMTITHGAKFGDDFVAADVIRENWGILNIEFFSCDTGQLTYSTNSGFGSGEMMLSRLTIIQNHKCDNKRDFHMGFTPFPSELSQQGFDDAYAIINENADIIAHHYDNGVPWPEMLPTADFEALPDTIKQEWQLRKQNTQANKKVYLALTPISISRNGLAPYKATDEDMPLSEIGEPWVSAAFNHPDVVQSYKNYVKTAVEFFKPDYLAIGIEVNILANNSPGKWQNYVDLNKQTYVFLHELYPNLPIFSSVFANDFYPNITDNLASEQIDLYRDIEPYSDYFALSAYPYLSALHATEIPQDYFKVLDEITNKPMVITESGQPAESITLGNITFDGSEQKQNSWIAYLLNQADKRDFRFVINFISKDYDTLCLQINCNDEDRLWEDTGLIDENGNPRTALTTWKNYLQKEIRK